MNKYKVKMYESLDDMRENYVTDQFIVISNEGLLDEEMKQVCLKRRNENEDENKDIEDFVWDIEYYNDEIEVIDLTKEQTNES